MLTAVLAAALGLWGPVDFSKLEKWQTLMAGSLAIVAAIIAYAGATASVRFNKATLDRTERRRKLGIYLRAEHTCNTLSDLAKSLAEKSRERYMGKRTVLLDELKIATQAPDLAEAWGNLEIFPTKAAFKLSQVQSCIRTLNRFVESQQPGASWEIGEDIPYSGQMKVTNDVAKDLRRACEDVLSEIQPIILEMSGEEHG